MHTDPYIEAGNKSNATKALIMIHGRGGSAEDILSLAPHFPVSDYALFAPQATSGSWYPNSFLGAPQTNEPGLTDAIKKINEIVRSAEDRGITADQIYFLGFSQGACLALEYVTRHAQRWGGVAAFTGGLIGDKIYRERYHGDFSGTPVFIGTSNPDFHVPVERVYATENIMREMGADITVKVYDNMGHTIIGDEITRATNLVFK